MKHTSKVLLLIISLFLLSGCSFSVLRESDQSSSEDPESEPRFTLEQVVLSKGLQNTEAKVDLSRKNNQLRLLISPGVVKSAGIDISKIEEVDGVYNIHLVNSSYSSAELVIPQITVLLSDVTASKAESMKFNIVNENFDPVTINFGIVDILNKINSDYKISTDRYPSISLVEEDDQPLWVIDYNSIYNTENLEIPVIDLTLKVSGTTGEVVESSKGLISTFHDFGRVLDFIPGKGILYYQENMMDSSRVLLFYSFSSKETIQLYNTHSEIKSASLSPNGTDIALLEKNGESNVAYLISTDDKKAVRIGSENSMFPEELLWLNQDEIQILTEFSNHQTQVMVYDAKDNTIRTSHNMMMDLSNFTVSEDIILASEYTEGQKNDRILLSNGVSGFRFVDNGFNPHILNDSMGMFLQNEDDSTANKLKIFDLKSLNHIYESDFDVAMARQISSNEMVIIENLAGNSSYYGHLLHLDTFELSHLGSLSNGEVYVDLESGKVYANPSITYRSELTDIIYSLDLSDLKRR